jgi:foldase protein PrsA
MRVSGGHALSRAPFAPALRTRQRLPSPSFLMTKAVRIFLALCALAVTAAFAVGCGGVPGDAVATVDGSAINKSDYNHWLNVASKSSGTNAVVPDAPNFTKCIAAKRKTTPKPAKGQPKTTDDQLKKQCQSEYNALRTQVVGLLVSYKWIQGEADKQGVKVSDAEVKKSFDSQRKQNFPKDADFQKFLKTSGQSQADILMRVKLDLLSQKIRDKVIKGKDQVSDAQIQAFYDKNKSRFTQPETRDLQIVLTKSQAKAQAAHKALQSGQPWGKVVKQYSVDDASKSNGGKLPGQAKGTLEKSLDAAAFSAPKNKLMGPVKTQFGYYVFRVTKINPAKTQSVADAKSTIKQTLVSQNQQKALDTFVADFRKRWREKTECQSGFTTSDCKNGPKPTPTPSAAPATQAPTQ